MSIHDFTALLQEAGVDRVYVLGSVPPSPAYPYAVVAPAPGAPQVRTVDGSGDPAGRFVVQHFGRTLESVTDLADRSFTAFDGKPLTTFPDPPVAWQEVASAAYRDPDDSGVLAITHTYRY